MEAGNMEIFNVSKEFKENVWKMCEFFHTHQIGDTTFTVPRRYINLIPIGDGGQGAVVSAFDTETNQKVAIKKIWRPFKSSAHAKRAFRELKLMSVVGHQNTVRLIDAFTPQRTVDAFKEIYLVMELLEGTLAQVPCAGLDHDKLSYLLYQMLCGVKHFHSAGIIHRDLKPGNMGVLTNCTLKIIDFGLARSVLGSSFDKLTPYVVTRYYRAPEIILGMAYAENVDVWSIGCIFGEMISGEVVFPGTDYIDQWNKIALILGTPKPAFISRLEPNVRAYVEQRPHFPGYSMEELFPDKYFQGPRANSSHTNMARDLLAKMLTIDPNERISVDDALLHPYLQSWYDISEVMAPASGTYDHRIEECDLEVHHWKDVIFEELLSIRTKIPIVCDPSIAVKIVHDHNYHQQPEQWTQEAC